MSDLTTFDSPVSARFEVDTTKRTIKGLAVPYGVAAMSRGEAFQFAPGTLTWSDVSRVKVLVGHDFERAVGVVTELEDTKDGLFMTARIAKGEDGDKALLMAEEGVWDGLSIGLGQGGTFEYKDGINHASSVPLMEVSITPMPSFEDARIQSVAASAVPTNTPRKEPTMGDENTTTVAPEAAPDFSAVTEAITKGFEALQTRISPREEVSAGKGAQFAVAEALPYRFDGTKGEHGFLADIVAAKFGSGDAGVRLDKFLTEAFANITTGNVAGHNPVPTRPELYVDNLHYNRPLWNMVTGAGLDDITAFIIPKFNSAAGLVGDHTQGVEPTEGSFTATTQTVTPTALSGKAILNREVVDQGGNPKVDAIIWNEMVAGYYDGVEESIQTVLNAVATGEQNFGAGADAKAKVMLLKAFLASLQFVKGGDRFSAFAADPTMYDTLTSAVDTTGRPLLPVLGPTNSDGSLAPSMESVSIGGKRAVPCWALNETVANAEESYLFVPSSVYAWVSAPRRIDIEYKVASVEIGIWGYKAAAVTRDSDVIPLDVTTADV